MKSLLTIAVPLLIAAAAVLTACSDDTCSDNGSSLPLVAFYVGTTQQSVYGLSITGIGVPGDSVLVNSNTVNQAYLPLRAGATSTAYALTRRHVNGQDTTVVRDTLTVDYRPVAFFHSKECGAMYNFDISSLTCTCHGIDSVVLLTPLITNSRATAMRIYFTELP